MPALLAALLLSQIPGSIDIDPARHWYMLETEHFTVHFSCPGNPDETSQRLAQEVADICEEVHTTLSPAVGWTPAGRTQIIIADFFDYSNGWATPFPDNAITVIPTLPAGERANDDNYLRTLLLHEYTHILEMDQARGFPRFLRHIFGRVALPNALAPVWLHEGYAVYNETRFTSFGRLRGTEFDSDLRATAREHRLLPIDRCGSYELERYPGGNAPYLYGSMFHGFAADRFGPDIWDRYNRQRSASLPFFENSNARRVLGASFYQLWPQWLAAASARAESVRQDVSGSPLTELRQLTAEGWHTSSPCWSRTGSEVYYVSRTGAEYPAIKAADSAARSTRVLHRGMVDGNLTLSPDGRLLAFGERRVVRNYYEYSDIFALDLYTGEVRPLTNGQRARDPDFAPDTNLLVFVSNHDGQNDLKLLDLASGEITSLTETDDHTSYHGPRFSPGGRWIAVGVNRPGGYADIELVDRRTGWTMPVTHDRANDLAPCWSRTGKFLLFASDRSGIYNLYAYQLATGQTFRCTNVEYGVFEPAVSPDNRRIALVSHSASGDDVSLTNYKAGDWPPAPEFNDTLPGTATAANEIEARLYYYNPFPAVLPRFWLPWVSRGTGWELGAFTLGWDVLQFHRYSAIAGYRTETSTPFACVNYELHQLRPVIGATLDADLRQQSGRLDAQLPFLSTWHAHWLDAGVDLTHQTHVDCRFDLAWAYSSAATFRFATAPNQGRALGTYADAQVASLLSDHTRTRAFAYGVQYFGAPTASWSFRAHLAAGTAFGDSTAAHAWQLQTGSGLLAVRGYAEPSDPARTVLAAGLQFRTPLWWIERGLGTAPFFLKNVNGALFCDLGTVAEGVLPGSTPLASSRIGVGAELRADLMLFHALPASLTAGSGFGLNPLWSHQAYVKLEAGLLAGLFTRPFSRDPRLRHLPEQL